MTEDTLNKQHCLNTPSLLRRMAAWLYEGMLLFGVIFIAGYLFGTLTQTRHAMTNRIGLQIFIFLVLGVYFVWLWSKGQTLAMKTWNIRVVNHEGVELTQVRALIRYLYSWVWFLPPLAVTTIFNLDSLQGVLLIFGWVLLWAIASQFHPERQFWHDVFAGTRLIHQPRKSKKDDSIFKS
jgi:uncharacterized RDD family membrane protein YckC